MVQSSKICLFGLQDSSKWINTDCFHSILCWMWRFRILLVLAIAHLKGCSDARFSSFRFPSVNFSSANIKRTFRFNTNFFLARWHRPSVVSITIMRRYQKIICVNFLMAQLCKDIHNTIFSRCITPKSDGVESYYLDTFVRPVGYRTVAFSDQYNI